MKKLFSVLLIFYWSPFLSQVSPQPNQEKNFIIGLPKVTFVQLEFLKPDLLDLPQIISAEYIYKEHCLLIESDPKTNEPLKFEDIERILLKYFSMADIYKKDTGAFFEIRHDNEKSDKFIFKNQQP